MLGDLGEHLLLSVEVADIDAPSAGIAGSAQESRLGLNALGGQVEQGDVGAVGAQGAGQAGTEAAACPVIATVLPGRSSFTGSPQG